MAISKAKKERAVAARRLAKVKALYPQYPCGVLDATLERELRTYVETGEVGWRLGQRLGV